MEAADDFNRDRVAEAASVAIFVEMDRVVDIAVAGDDAMPSQYIEKRFTFGRIVWKRLIDCGDQSEARSDSRSQPMIKWPWQMKGPVAIADHVMNPHGDRALGHRLKNLQRRRIMFENSTRDRKSTRLNSSHTVISYAVFCLKSEEHTSELQS